MFKILIMDEKKPWYKLENTASASNEKASVGECLTQQEMMKISSKILRKEHRQLARELKLTQQQIEDIENRCEKYDGSEITYEILQTWTQMNGKAATRFVLKDALISFKRQDIVDELFSDLPIDPRKMRQYKEIQAQIGKGQRELCIKVELPQVHWTKRILPLEELYVNLELITNVDDHESKGKPIQLEEMFHQIDGRDPVRILIEGGPGYGKTTLCLKLLNDFGNAKEYISAKFKMIFQFQLRYFKQNDSIEEMLTRECKILGFGGDDGIECIKAFAQETLLILDGFDEMNEECKQELIPLLQKNKYPTMSVVVTSRRGMFEVEKQKGKQSTGFYEITSENADTMWHKRIVIKGVTTDKTEPFLRKYLQEKYLKLELDIKSVTGGIMREVFECPLFLILLAMMLEEKTPINVNSKTTLYKEFFNFIIRRNLIRENKISDDEEIDVFNQSSETLAFQSLDQFGQLAIECLYQNKLTLEENEILKLTFHKTILELGFLTKIPQVEGRKRENFYQPIHKSFLEFVAAFTIFNLFQKDEGQFRTEIERIGSKGLKPTNDSLFYVFLGGLMNSKAYVLFECLTCYSLWFNIESLCFANILLEIQDIHSFFPRFKPMLDSFIPSFYHIIGTKGLTKEYFQSEIHSLILKHSNDRQLIKCLEWNSNLPIRLSHELHVECLKLYLTNKIFLNENLVKCKNVICKFSNYFDPDHWSDFVSLLNSIQSEKVHFLFYSPSNAINSLVFPLLREELNGGRWKRKNIDRLRFELDKFDDPRSLSFLVELVEKSRINEGVNLWIHKSEKRTDEEKILLRSKTEELFNAVTRSNTIKQFVVINDDSKFSPAFNFNRVNSHMKTFHVEGSLYLLDSDEMEEKKYSMDEFTILSVDDEKDFSLIQNIQGMKYLNCKVNCCSSLVEKHWHGLTELEELELLFKPESVQFLNSISCLRNLQVLSLNVTPFKMVPSDSKEIFINIFSSLNLKICEFLSIRNLELFSFFIEVLMEGLKKKKNEGNKVQLQELVVSVRKLEMNLNHKILSKGIQCIQSMLQDDLLQQFCWVNRYNSIDVIRRDELEYLFPSKNKFDISYKLNGMNPNSSRRSQFQYHWFQLYDSFCIKLPKHSYGFTLKNCTIS